MTDRASRGRIAEIEALRGVAILMVLVEHLPLNLFYWRSALYDFGQRYWRGAAGVDLFFAVSGFVIARSLLPQVAAAARQRRRGRVLAAFWLRRAARLLPAAWLWIAVPLALTLVFNHSGAFGGWQANLHCGIAGVLNVANIYVAHVFGRHDPGINSPYWSLSLEEQFYAVFPLLALTAGRLLPLLLVGCVAYQFVLPLWPLANLTRPGGLAAGVLIALLHGSAQRERWRPPPVPPWLGAALLGGGVALCGAMLAEIILGTATFAHRTSDAWRYGVGFGGLAVVSAALVHAAGYGAGYLLGPGRGRDLLAWIGARSYALYLSHRTAYAAAREILYRCTGDDHPGTTPGALLLMAIAFPLLVAAAQLTYYFIERPFRARGAALAARIATEGAARAG